MLLYVDAQYASPYALSVFAALHEKGVSFDMHAIDLGAGANLGPEYIATSLTARVPALSHGDFSLSESSAITEYLDAAFPDGTPLYPTEIHQRARARQVQAWLRSDLGALREERSTQVVFYNKRFGPLSPAGQAAAERLFAGAGALIRPDREHLFDAWSIVDVDLALMLNRLVLHGDAVPAPLADYATRQWRRPSVRRWRELERPPL